MNDVDLQAWQESIQTSMATLLSDFADRYGYAPGQNLLAPPASREQQAALAAALRDGTPDQLARFYDQVGHLDLPDFWNGLWILAPDDVAKLHSTDGFLRITGKVDTSVLVFAQDGGGNVFGLALPTGRPVYAMPQSALLAGVYQADDGLDVVAEDFNAFLHLISTQLHNWATKAMPPTFF